MFLIASSTFWPSWRTPSTTSSEIEVALRSSRTRTTVPSRIRRTIGSSANERPFQASQSALHLAPHPAHRVLADRAAKQGGERPTHPPRVGASQIGAGDQCVGRPGCGADKPATPRSSTPSSCPPRCSVGHAAPQSRSARTCPDSDRDPVPWRWPAMPLFLLARSSGFRL